MPSSHIDNRKVYQVVAWVLLFVSVFVLIRLAPILNRPEYLSIDDFGLYWAGGKLNISGENPYDPQKIESIKIAAGR